MAVLPMRAALPNLHETQTLEYRDDLPRLENGDVAHG
jgi:hypothetical protein